MRTIFRIELLFLALFAAACASSTPPSGDEPANIRTFTAPFERVWSAAKVAAPRVWAADVQSADEMNGVLIFQPRAVNNVAISPGGSGYPPGARPGSAIRDQRTERLSIFVSRGSDIATRVSVRIENDAVAAGETDSADDRTARRVLDEIGRELSK